MNSRSIVIVIPIYRVSMKELEKVSWRQLQRILGEYPICMVAPMSIAAELTSRYQVHVEAFPNEYFQSVSSYSRMMLTCDFYQRFQEFEYMLLYQLDAFVFSDRLKDFCQMGYDYIGAPWPCWVRAFRPVPIPHVGNGGFSLRKISSICRILERRDELFREMSPQVSKMFLDAEDNFWAWCGSQPQLSFHVSNPIIAKQFSIEHQNRFPKDFTQHLPFGCHSWNRFTYCLWRPIIQQYGYKLPKLDLPDPREDRKKVLRRYLVERMLRDDFDDEVLYQFLVSLQLPAYGTIAIWGWGIYGHLIDKILQKSGYTVTKIYDKRDYNFTEDGRKIQYPDLKQIIDDGNYIVVSTQKYENEICDNLINAGLKEYKDYICISKLLHGLSRIYMRFIKNGCR